MTTTRAVFFDLDGTLLDTLDDLATSMNTTLRRLGFPTHPRDAYRYFVGDGMETLARRVLPDSHRDPPTVERCVAGMREVYGENWATTTRPYPGIPELLDELVARGLPLVILSNKPDDFTRLAVQQLLPSWQFAAVAGVRPGVPKKPDPTAAIALAREIDVPPPDILYLGDTNTDMMTATGAGMTPVGALWGFRSSEELRSSGARLLISTPLELLSHLS